MNSRVAHIHTPCDGRGLREILLNGHKIKRCFYADTKKGVCRAYRDPLVMDKHGKRALFKTYHGTITVMPLSEAT